MAADDIACIEAYFQQNDGDGDFANTEATEGYRVIFAAQHAPVAISRKTHALLGEMRKHHAAIDGGFIGRCSLPCNHDIRWLRQLTESRNVFFYGDLDSPDLLYYAWLCNRLSPTLIQYAGLTDRCLLKMGVKLADLPRLKCSPSELQAIPLVKRLLPTLTSMVGPECAVLFEKGEKVELESLIAASCNSIFFDF